MNAQTLNRKANPLRVIGWSLAALVLIVPAVSMQFSQDVNWGPGDFLVMGALMLLVGGAIEMVVRFVPATGKVKLGLVAIALLAFFAIWAELAVGIFD